MRLIFLICLIIPTVFCVSNEDPAQNADMRASFCEGVCLKAVPGSSDRPILMVPRNEEQKERYETDERNFEKCRGKCVEMYSYDSENEDLLDKLTKIPYELCK